MVEPGAARVVEGGSWLKNAGANPANVDHDIPTYQNCREGTALALFLSKRL
jgi:hypothetical protein